MGEGRQHRTRLRTSPVGTIATAAFLAAVAGGGGEGVAAASAWAWPAEISASAFESTIRSWGSWGVAGSILLMIAHTFIPFPAEFVAIANGMVYGPIWGTVITWTGAMLGAFVGFGLARAFGRPLVQRMIARKDWRRVDAWTARQGTAAVFVGRFVPVISFNLINWAAGLTNMSWWTFTWATGLGILPMTALMVGLGHNIERLPWWGWLGLVIAALALWAVGRQVQRLITPPATPPAH